MKVEEKVIFVLVSQIHLDLDVCANAFFCIFLIDYSFWQSYVPPRQRSYSRIEQRWERKEKATFTDGLKKIARRV